MEKLFSIILNTAEKNLGESVDWARKPVVNNLKIIDSITISLFSDIFKGPAPYKRKGRDKNTHHD